MSYQTTWSGAEKFSFRFLFIYFLIQIVPLDFSYYGSLLSTNWIFPSLSEVFALTHYAPSFFSGKTYAINSVFLLSVIISLIAAFIWTYKDKSRNDYTFLYQILRIVLRYRLAAAFIAYAFIKVFPLQMPSPTLSDLNTDYGDFLPWKIYFLTTGLAKANYESVIGFTELFAGILLLYRRTATIGGLVAAGLLLNIIPANFAYEIGDQSYSLYLFSIALFIVSYDVPRIYTLLTEKSVQANRIKISFSSNQQKVRIALKSVFVIIFIIYGVNAYTMYKKGNDLLPRNPGLKNAYGLYNVREFKWNNKNIPYSNIDPTRWQDVVFEKWNTISIKINRPLEIDTLKPNFKSSADLNRTYELAGSKGRHYYFYTIDSGKQVLHLQNKNPKERNDRLDLNYSMPDSATLLLWGVNQSRDSIHATLDRIKKKYLLIEGRRKPIRL